MSSAVTIKVSPKPSEKIQNDAGSLNTNRAMNRATRRRNVTAMGILLPMASTAGPVSRTPPMASRPSHASMAAPVPAEMP